MARSVVPPPENRRLFPVALAVLGVVAVLFLAARGGRAPDAALAGAGFFPSVESLRRAPDPAAPAPLPAPARGGGFGFPRRVRDGEATPRIAVVFDDLGYTLDGLAGELLRFPVKLTFAVLPGLPHSEAFAEAARARGHDVLLHVAMEPIDLQRHDPGERALFVDLGPQENLRRLRSQLEAISGYCGISNHMGSRFTARPRAMDLVLGEVRRSGRDLFFLDSRTTPRSRVPEAARRAGVPCLVNDLFLDGRGPDGRVPPVRTRIEPAARIARERGYAIVIGHLHRETVEAVRTAIERWSGEGIALVGLSDLMHR